MSFYSIAQLEELSGIKAHTIRMWEQRYGLLKPDRTDSNIRLYDDDQLRKLLNTTLLINNGIKISKAATFTEKEIDSVITRMISEQKSPDFFSEAIVNQLIAAGLEFSEINFDKAFASAILRFGLKDTYIKIIYPLLVRTGLLWSNAGISPCQEHFLTNLIKRKLHAAIDSLPTNPSAKQRWILFLPEEEDHEIGLLFANFILKNAGNDVIYLGQRVPYASLKNSIKDSKSTVLLFFLVRHHPRTILNMLFRNLTRDFSKSSIIVSCGKNELKGISVPGRIKNTTSIEEFLKMSKIPF
jgi:MerR family transcriptional regulator, light-induced transcriptional regulator